MIVLLDGSSNGATARAIALNLQEAFKDHVEISLENASSLTSQLENVCWDDLLIVLFEGAQFPEAGNDYIREYQQRRGTRALVLPVALDVKHTKPPKSAETIKALPFDSVAAGIDGRLVKRVGAMIGLSVQQRHNSIFISYRAKDGTELAMQLEHHLKSLGYPVWRDEAPEIDGNTKILPGTDVQIQIDDALDKANIVLLLDTPESPHSIWIQHEVDTANGLLLPVLPLCFKTKDDLKKGPRFRSLLQLQRWVTLPLPETLSTSPLTNDELELIVEEMEAFLCDVFRRKCRVPFIVEREFVSRNFSWQMLNQRLLISESSKEHSIRLKTKVLSHCSVFDPIHGPALEKFCAFLKATGSPNHSLYIYDGELIPEPQLKEIIGTITQDNGVVILHHQELAALIDSNFTALTV